MIEINRSVEFTFLSAWEKVIDNKDIIITSKITGASYKVEKVDKKDRLKFFNPVIGTWQTYYCIEEKEIFGVWYVTKIDEKVN